MPKGERALSAGWRRLLAACLAAAACASCLAAPEAPIASGAADLARLRQAQFCETREPLDATGCQWRLVTLPHRWKISGDAPSWALYRFHVEEPPVGAFGVLTDNLSLHGIARSGGETLTPSGVTRAKLPHLRYWPQLFVFQPVPHPGPTRLVLDLAVRGHPQAKNGLGGVVLGPLQATQEMHSKEILFEVVLVLALSAASLMAGFIGLFAGNHRTLTDSLLRLVSLLAIVAGTRASMNFIVEPWLPWPAWQALGMWLLFAVSVLTCATLATYLRPGDRRIAPVTAATLVLLGLLLLLTPGPWRFIISEVVFIALAASVAVLTGVLAWVGLRRRDPLSLTLLLPIVLALLSGVHDLALHMGAASLSDRYLQKWATPALLTLLIVLLGRRAQAQRSVASALQRETARRHDLLRDLHDGIGSRLVALAYHARQKPGHGPFAEEIDRLIHELQLIQGAVRADATTLDLLVADLRHLYSRVGGGSLPIVWEVSDLPSPCPLSAEQAVATARIVEEAVANALRHAGASRITVSLKQAPPPAAAELTVCDDGNGRFEEGLGAGLRHMRLRAERAGLWLTLEQPGPDRPHKVVRLRFAPAMPRRGWLATLATGLGLHPHPQPLEER